MICIKGKRISNYLIQSDKMTYPIKDSKYLKTLPLYKESYILLEKINNGLYKLLKFVFI